MYNLYPFGSPLPTRTYQSGEYRYGFQGQEKENDVVGEGLSYKFRIHDARVGRFLSVDPLTEKYPHYSPYSFSGNKVINAVELEGLEEHVLNEIQDKEGNIVSQELSFDENAEPLEDGKIYVATYSAGSDNPITTVRNVPDINYQGGFLNPIAAPESIMGTTGYYTFRDDDFKVREGLMKSGLNAPKYYLAYGDKYVKRFTEQTKPKLSVEGQEWLDKALVNLQEAIEDKLKESKKFERDDIEFNKYAFDSHVSAYLRAGLLNLGPIDALIIGTTPDWADLTSENGRNQALKIAPLMIGRWKTKVEGEINEGINKITPNWIKKLGVE